jgi:hypothetical protein
MGTNARLFWVLAGFFFFADALYIFWSFADTGFGGEIEWVGAIAIGLSGLLAVLIAFYLGRIHATQGGELPEDRLDADIDDGEAEQGHFSPWSWWPLTLGFAAAIVVLGLAIGPWISFIGVGLLLVSIVGWVYEYYRGYFSH